MAHPHTIDKFVVRGQAVVEWPNPNPNPNRGETQCYLAHPDPPKKHVNLEVYFQPASGGGGSGSSSKVSSGQAFFKLRVPVLLKHSSSTLLYFFVPPNHILSLEGTTECDAPEMARANLSGSLMRIQFHLHTPGLFIVPKMPLEPKKQATDAVIRAMRSLAQATTVSVYLQEKTMSKKQLRALHSIATESVWETLARHMHLGDLYSGTGAIVDDADDNTCNATTTPDDPPSYDEIGPGPPVPPIGQDRKGRKRPRPVSSGSESSLQVVNVKKHATSHVQKDQVLLRLDLLEGLVKSQQLEIVELKGLVQTQQEDISELRAKVAGLEGDITVLQTDDAVDALDVKVIQQEEVLRDLDEKVQAVWEEQDEIADKVYDKLRDDIHDLGEELRDNMLQRMRSAFEPPYKLFFACGNLILMPCLVS